MQTLFFWRQKMANPNPNTIGIEKNRGVKPKLNRRPVQVKLTREEQSFLEYVSTCFGLVYNDKGSISELLQEIAAGRLIVAQAPPPRK
jgi:hypothetical protein